eukprot:IDg2452t1
MSRGERIDLAQSVCTREQAHVAENSRMLCGLRVATGREVANAVACVRATRGREGSFASRIRITKAVPETFHSKPMF